jgi:hypothetical protein
MNDMSDELDAIVSFLTSEVDLPMAAQEAQPKEIWWEQRDGWVYPWRIVRHTDTGATGYPCGEPFRDPYA